MRCLRQIAVLTGLALLGLPQRKWLALVLIISVACVVGVLLSMLSVSTGMLRAYRSDQDPALAIVLAPETLAEYGSQIPADAIGTILDAPGIAHDASNYLLGDAEFLFWIPPSGAYVIGSPNLRGIGRQGLALRPHFKVVAGRQFLPGRQEVMVGRSAARAFQLRVGDRIILPGGAWPIVGEFTDDGSILEGQYLGNADTIMSAGLISGYSSVLVRLQNPSAFGAFRHWLEVNPDLKVNAEPLADFDLRTVKRTTAFFTGLTWLVAVVMALGALFGIVKLMYAAVSARTREIATLRSIGYQPLPLGVSILLETTILSLVGATLGAALAWTLFHHRPVLQMRTAFDLALSPSLILFGLLWAVTLALLGGLPPAVRAARLPVSDALRVL